MRETLFDEQAGRLSAQPQIFGQTRVNPLIQLMHLLLKQTQLVSRQHLCSPDQHKREESSAS